MSFRDIFRDFFRGSGTNNYEDYEGDMTDDSDDRNPFHGFGVFTHPPGFGGAWSHPDEDTGILGDDEGPPGRHGPFPPGGGPFFSFDEEITDMFKHFEEMFKNFGLADFPPLGPGMEHLPSGKASSTSPRDHMLKQPDTGKDERQDNRPTGADGNRDTQPLLPSRESLSWFEELKKGRTLWNVPSEDVRESGSTKKEDKDLDDAVRQGDLDRIFGGRLSNQPAPQQPQFRSYSRSISVQTIRKPDGTIETRRTERDDKGNVTTTVTSSHDHTPHPDNRGPGRPHIIWPRRERATLPGSETVQKDEKRDSIFQKFFGSWSQK